MAFAARAPICILAGVVSCAVQRALRDRDGGGGGCMNRSSQCERLRSVSSKIGNTSKPIFNSEPPSFMCCAGVGKKCKEDMPNVIG